MAAKAESLLIKEDFLYILLYFSSINIIQISSKAYCLLPLVAMGHFFFHSKIKLTAKEEFSNTAYFQR